jgi:hypothetical protein
LFSSALLGFVCELDQYSLSIASALMQKNSLISSQLSRDLVGRSRNFSVSALGLCFCVRMHASVNFSSIAYHIVVRVSVFPAQECCLS